MKQIGANPNPNPNPQSRLAQHETDRHLGIAREAAEDVSKETLQREKPNPDPNPNPNPNPKEALHREKSMAIEIEEMKRIFDSGEKEAEIDIDYCLIWKEMKRIFDSGEKEAEISNMQICMNEISEENLLMKLEISSMKAEKERVTVRNVDQIRDLRSVIQMELEEVKREKAESILVSVSLQKEIAALEERMLCLQETIDSTNTCTLYILFLVTFAQRMWCLQETLDSTKHLQLEEIQAILAEESQKRDCLERRAEKSRIQLLDFYF